MNAREQLEAVVAGMLHEHKPTGGCWPWCVLCKIQPILASWQEPAPAYETVITEQSENHTKGYFRSTTVPSEREALAQGLTVGPVKELMQQYGWQFNSHNVERFVRELNALLAVSEKENK